MKDVSIYERKGRPVFYISYYSAEKMRRVHEATPFRTDNPEGKRCAYEMALQKGKEAAIYRQSNPSERWEAWVNQFLESRYHAVNQAKTLRRYKQAWHWP